MDQARRTLSRSGLQGALLVEEAQAIEGFDAGMQVWFAGLLPSDVCQLLYEPVLEQIGAVDAA